MSHGLLRAGKLLAHCHDFYENHLVACNVLDFGDLILRPTKLPQRDEAVRERCLVRFTPGVARDRKIWCCCNRRFPDARGD
ncbi:MAG: ATP-dependent DNA helicase Rep [Sodalis sp.]|nr:MAG: ATP-dependent DNA helicase Rep [Sodalis sp.]